MCAITDRRLYGKDGPAWLAQLLDQTALWAANGVDLIQLREKDLPPRELAELARAMMDVIVGNAGRGAARTRLLINGRADVAMAAGADGVHLPGGADALTPSEIRKIFTAGGHMRTPTVSVSCHTLAEVRAARREMADCILFAPVFEKIVGQDPLETRRLRGTGLSLLEEACRAAAPVSVLALGGVTAENAAQCVRAGAAGIAAIRLLQEPASAWGHLAQR